MLKLLLINNAAKLIFIKDVHNYINMFFTQTLLLPYIPYLNTAMQFQISEEALIVKINLRKTYYV